MKFVTFFCFFGMLWSWGQAEPKETDSISKKYLIVVGDTITKQSIDLDEVLILPRLRINSGD
ncbi:MAG: DUF4294 domain-containing protein, partial [Flavobacteriaceae bacterium]